MCGIFALVQPSKNVVDVRDIKRACSLMQHRGPDQSGYALLHNRTVGFGHNRLSIQDPSAPPQPLVDPSTGTTIIFNGEVYDHTEIGAGLKEEHGTVLSEASDTAVILGLYNLYGPTPKFFSRLNGEFAFIIWDARRKTLVAVRDRFGVKPMFWYRDSSRLIFASEIKAILSVNGVKRKFSQVWLDSLLMHPPTVTFAEGVFAVHPGMYLTMDLSNNQWDPPKYHTYWSALSLTSNPNTTITYGEAKAKIRQLLVASVKRRMIADREMCVLSGGVDSTILCGIISSLGHRLTLFSMGFGDQLDLGSDEDPAAKTAEYYSLHHERVNFASDDAARFAEKTIYHTEIPITNPLAVAKLCLSRFAREKDFIVSLSGEGSDELFLDYSSFRLEILLEMRSRGEAQVIMTEQLAEGLSDKDTTLIPGTTPKGTPRETPYCHADVIPHSKVMDTLQPPGHSFGQSVDQYTPLEADGLSGMRMIQLWLIDRLHKYTIPCLGDRVEMANSMEGRSPLLDQKFADFVLRLPSDYLVDPNTLTEKKILYDAFEDMLPPHIFTQTPKQPSAAAPWCEALFDTEAGQELLDKHLSWEALEHVGVWLPERVGNMIAELRDGAAELDIFLGLILSVQIMHDLFIENPCVGDSEFLMVDKMSVNEVAI